MVKKIKRKNMNLHNITRNWCKKVSTRDKTEDKVLTLHCCLCQGKLIGFSCVCFRNNSTGNLVQRVFIMDDEI